MIAISQSEKDAILAEVPTAHIARTMKQKSKRKHYYCEESDKVMRVLKRIRGAEYKGGV